MGLRPTQGDEKRQGPWLCNRARPLAVPPNAGQTRGFQPLRICFSTGAYPDFLLHRTRQRPRLRLSVREPHELNRANSSPQEIRGSGVERSAVRISRKDKAQQPDRILQISPLRFAPVEMTKGRAAYFLSGGYWEQAEIFRSL